MPSCNGVVEDMVLRSSNNFQFYTVNYDKHITNILSTNTRLNRYLTQ
jgi:hypothetical protein